MSATGAWTLDDLMGDADLVLPQAKADGRSGVRLLTPAMRSLAQTRSPVISGPHQAWERQGFELHVQPQVGLATAH